jgi:hypothetical protein
MGRIRPGPRPNYSPLRKRVTLQGNRVRYCYKRSPNSS